MSNGLKLPIKATIADFADPAFKIENTGGNVAVAGTIAGVLPTLAFAIGVQGTCSPTQAPGLAIGNSIGVQGINNTVAIAAPGILPPVSITAVGVEGVSNGVLHGPVGPLDRIDSIGVPGRSDNGTAVKANS